MFVWILSISIMKLRKCGVVCNMCFSREKGQLSTIIQKGGCFSFNWLFELEESPGKIMKHESSYCHLEASVILKILENVRS